MFFRAEWDCPLITVRNGTAFGGPAGSHDVFPPSGCSAKHVEGLDQHRYIFGRPGRIQTVLSNKIPCNSYSFSATFEVLLPIGAMFISFRLDQLSACILEEL